MIENVDPLTKGEMMWPVPEPPVEKRFVRGEVAAFAPMPASRVRNASRDEQDEVAKGRVERPSTRAKRPRGTSA